MTAVLDLTEAVAGAAPGPAFRPGPEVLRLGLASRRETDADVPFLRDLYVSMRWDELTVVDWSQESKLGFLHQQFAAQRSHYRTFYTAADFLVLLWDGRAVGRLYLNRSPREIRVVDIGFLPEYRNRGFGRAVFESLFAEARETGRLVSIHVEHFNPAQRLYLQLGFQVKSQEGPYYLMEWAPDN